MNRDKVFVGFRNVQNFVKDKVTVWGCNKTFANLTDFHTCATSSVDLVIAVILVARGEFLQLTCYVVGGTGVGVPICVDAVAEETERWR